MPSFVEIGLPVLEKIVFEGVLPYMVAILVMLPGLFINSLVAFLYKIYILNLA